MQTRYLIGSVAAASLAAAIVSAPVAAADPDEVSNLPACTSTSDGSAFTGTQTTECATPGNVQIDAQAPAPVDLYPFDDDFFYGSAFVGGGDGPQGGGGGHGGR